ncbi:MAG: hypothetical protein ABSD63_00725 [Candidatus Korobacteraceae bacterium]|jgi:cytochrome c5
MNNRKALCVLALAAFATTGSMGHSQSPQASKQAPQNSSTQSQHIVLPQYPADILPGPNVQVYERYCLICHTARYVSMQPRFPRGVWQSEVKKMIDAYGAAIPEADQALIVEYLVAVRGIEAPSAAATPAK